MRLHSVVGLLRSCSPVALGFGASTGSGPRPCRLAPVRHTTADKDSAVSPFPRRLAVFTAILTAAALAVGAWLALDQGWPGLVPLVVLCGAMSFSRHRSVPLTNGVFVTPLPMVVMASVVVFTAEHSLLGPMLVGAAKITASPAIGDRIKNGRSNPCD